MSKFLSKITPEMPGGETDKVHFVLGNGVKVIFDLNECSEEMIRQLAIHGASQKIGDKAAGYAKARDFHGAFGGMQTTADNLKKGIWAAYGGGSGTTDLAAALVKLTKQDLETVQASLDTATEEEIAAFKKNAQVKAVILEIQAARQKALAKANAEDSPDLGEMLKSLGKA